MTSNTSRDWKFCPYAGQQLKFDPVKGTASCSVSGYRRDLSGELQPSRSVESTKCSGSGIALYVYVLQT